MNLEFDVQSGPAANQRNVSRPRTRLAAAVLVSMSLVGCFGAWRNVEDPALTDPELRRARIEALRTAIDQDHTTLEDLITRPDVPEAEDLHKDPQIRAIAVRLTESERALRRFEAAEAADGAPATEK